MEAYKKIIQKAGHQITITVPFSFIDKDIELIMFPIEEVKQLSENKDVSNEELWKKAEQSFGLWSNRENFDEKSFRNEAWMSRGI